jgi:hypothetical protein
MDTYTIVLSNKKRDISQIELSKDFDLNKVGIAIEKLIYENYSKLFNNTENLNEFEMTIEITNFKISDNVEESGLLLKIPENDFHKTIQCNKILPLDLQRACGTILGELFVLIDEKFIKNRFVELNKPYVFDINFIIEEK